MLRTLRKIRAPKIRSLNEIHIDAQKIKNNYTLLQSLHPEDWIFPVVKSNAYGHGISEIVTILNELNPPYICVDSFPEYQIIKKHSNSKALIIWETFPENYRYYKQEYATVCVYNINTIKYLVSKKRKTTIHLFLNTWMNREWLQMQDLWFVLPLLKQAKHIIVEWVMSHFANADELDKSFNQAQIQTFKSMTRLIEKELWTIKRKHLWNSAWTATMDDDFFNWWRTWLSLYWYSPFHEDDSSTNKYEWLQPALTLYSTVVATQQIEKDDWISYWLHWKTNTPTTVWTVPFWYTEWFDRWLRWKNRQIKIKDTYYPLVWTICMNLSCFHCWDDEVNIWDRVVLIDPDSSSPNTMYALANKLDTVAYETLVKLSPTIKRTII